MAMVTQHGVLVFLREPDSLQLDIMEGGLRIRGDICTLIEIALLELVGQ